MKIDNIWSVAKKFIKSGKYIDINFRPDIVDDYEKIDICVIDNGISNHIDMRIGKDIEWYDYETFAWILVENEQFIIDKLGGLNK